MSVNFMYKIVQTPEILSQIYDSPSKLFIKGSIDLSAKFVAIVGSRRASSDGLKFAYELAYELARREITIVSGLAVGIDKQAHLGALDAGGRTIAVLPSGIGRIYPTTHEVLARKIINCGGCLISENGGGAEPRKHDFLKRNRIIAGLSEATVVIEAATRSGALSTARHAMEAGREVLAVPGSPYSPLSEGTNNLIRQGAGMVTSYKDVLAALGSDEPARSTLVANSPEESSLLKLLRHGALEMDELSRKAGMSHEQLQPLVSEMEIKGTLERLPGNRVRRR